MNTENLSTLKIHKLTQEQYDRELEAGRIDKTALYLTPAEDKLVGKNVEGEEFSFLYGNTIPVSYVAEQGAEVFNDYENNIASGLYSHAEGFNTRAIGEYSHVQGKYNIEDMNEEYAHIVGNGTSDTNRSNAHTIDWDGNAWYQGDIYVGSTSGTNKDGGSKKLATEEYVDSALADKQPMGDYLTTILSEYVTKTELNTKGYLTSYTETDPTVPAWAKASEKPSYTASEVGADASGTASAVVSAHNTATDAHADIRAEIANVDAKIVSEVMTMTQEQYDSMTQAQFAALYKQGVRIIAVDVSGDSSGDSESATVINQMSVSIDEDGNIYNGIGYKNGYRLNSSGGETATEDNIGAVTGYIRASAGDVIRIDYNSVQDVHEDENLDWYITSMSNYINAYDSNFNYICGCTSQGGGLQYGDYKLWDTMDIVDGVSVVTLANIANIAYIRVSALSWNQLSKGDGSLVIVTVNQEI